MRQGIGAECSNGIDGNLQGGRVTTVGLQVPGRGPTGTGLCGSQVARAPVTMRPAPETATPEPVAARGVIDGNPMRPATPLRRRSGRDGSRATPTKHGPANGRRGRFH